MSAAEQLPLFALPVAAPTWPTRGTLAEKALIELLDGRKLDHPTFEAETGSWRLAALVFQLRALGWPVQTLERFAPSIECPSRVIGVYHLSARALAELVAPRGGPRT